MRICIIITCCLFNGIESIRIGKSCRDSVCALWNRTWDWRLAADDVLLSWECIGMLCLYLIVYINEILVLMDESVVRSCVNWSVSQGCWLSSHSPYLVDSSD